MTLPLNIKAMLVSVAILIVWLGAWEIATPRAAAVGEMTEYEMLMGGGAPKAGIPAPSEIIAKAVEELSNPFYDAGPNDKGIGIQIGYSLFRVLAGYLLAALIALPVGFLIGMSPLMHKALDPYIQVLRPISPLAWLSRIRNSARGIQASGERGRRTWM